MDIICRCCGISKNETEFSFKNLKTGLRNKKCKTCHAEYVKKHYLNNKDVYKQKAIVSKRKQRTDVRNFLMEIRKNSKGVNCEENHPDVLDFHHINNDKEFNIAGADRPLEVIKKEIGKCIVLCSNCHRKLHWSEKYNAPMAEQVDAVDSKSTE